jgi:Sulfotransferase family
MAQQGGTVKRKKPVERRFERPYRPVGLRMANYGGWALRHVRPGALSLDRDQLVEFARQRTGLVDVDLSFVPGANYLDALDRFLASLDSEAALTPTGRYFAREQVITSLSNRLALSQALADDPGLADRSLSPAIVIIGLPRSGTTLLQHLLARDPAHRVLRQWEALRPAAQRGPELDVAAQRATDRSFRLLDYLAPDARALHPVDTFEPTECVTLFSNSFASLELATFNQVPSYLSWCLQSDLADAYREYAFQLRMLESHERRRRWLLKSPAHLFWVDQLLDVLPQARIVQIHRDPLEVLGSFCSLSAVLSGIGSDHVDLRALGERWAPAWAEGLGRADRARKLWSAERFLDVEYTDLVGNPMGEVQRIYEGFGLDLDENTRALMAGFLSEHRQHAQGVHRYSLAQFGLDADSEADRFGRYRREVTG